MSISENQYHNLVRRLDELEFTVKELSQGLGQLWKRVEDEKEHRLGKAQRELTDAERWVLSGLK